MKQYTIPLIKSPFHRTKEVKRKLARFVLTSDRFSMGPECLAFEKVFSTFQGRKYTVLFNSGSSANFALVQTLVNLRQLSPKDLVGFTSIGWPTTIMPLLQLSIQPVPVDIDMRYLNTSLETLDQTVSLLARKNKKLKALFYTNILGSTGDIDKIKTYCKKKDIILLEDNCESLGSKQKGIHLGNFGLAGTFSFFVGHHFSCIEGGAVCTDDKTLADMLIMVRAHGWDRSLDPKTQQKLRKQNGIDDFNAQYTFYTLGMNLRPTELTGYLGMTQIKYLKEIITKRQKNFMSLLPVIRSRKDVLVDVYQNKDMTVVSNFAVPLVFLRKEDSLRARLMFEKAGVEVRPIIGGNLVTQPFFRSYNKIAVPIPNTELVTNQGFYFGNNPELNVKDIALLKKLILAI